jgi:hypothetical protein
MCAIRARDPFSRQTHRRDNVNCRSVSEKRNSALPDFRATDNDQVMEKVDSEGNVIGFSVLRVSSLKKTEVALR